MSKILVLTSAVLAAGVAGITKAFTDNPEDAAADVLVLETERAAAVAIAEQSLEALEKQPAVKSDVPSFYLEEKTFGFNFRSMIHNGKRITTEDVLKSEELQHELVSMGSGMIYQKA